MSVLWRECAALRRDLWVAFSRHDAGGDDRFEGDLESDVVTEIEDIEESLTDRERQAFQTIPSGISAVTERASVLGETVPCFAAEIKDIEMVVAQIESELHHPMQVVQRLVAAQFDPPPDRFLPRQFDLETVEGRRAGRRGGRERFVFFDPAVECDPTYLDWLRERGITYSGRRLAPSFFRVMAGGETRDLVDREVTTLTLALAALNQFLTHYEPVLVGPFLPDDPLRYQASVGTGRDKHAVDVHFPPPGEG